MGDHCDGTMARTRNRRVGWQSRNLGNRIPRPAGQIRTFRISLSPHFRCPVLSPHRASANAGRSPANGGARTRTRPGSWFQAERWTVGGEAFRPSEYRRRDDPPRGTIPAVRFKGAGTAPKISAAGRREPRTCSSLLGARRPAGLHVFRSHVEANGRSARSEEDENADRTLRPKAEVQDRKRTKMPIAR
jgi:hypothetical protein